MKITKLPLNPPKKNALKGRNLKKNLFLICILALPVMHWCVFWLYVNFSSFVLAFKNNSGEWSLINFKLFWSELTSRYGETLGVGVVNTFKYFSLNMFVILPLSVIISYFIYKKIKCYRFFRIIFFLPSILSGVALTSVYSNMISPIGPIGKLLTAIGVQIPAEGFLMNADTATNAILVYCLWTGFATKVTILSSAMARVPIEVLESSRLDGCTGVRELRSMVLPLIWPSISTLIIFELTGIFSASGPILLFQPDGGYGTMTISFWIFSKVYGSSAAGNNYGLVSCMGLIFTCIGVPIIMLIRWLIEKIPSAEY